MKRTFFVLLLVLITASMQLQAEPITVKHQDTIANNNVVKEKSLITKYTDNLNYVTITLLMTIESSFIPFPSEVVVPPAAYRACIDGEELHVSDNKIVNIFIVILFATLGALIGGGVNYFLAFYLGRPFIYWFVETKFGHLCLLNKLKVQKAESYFVKHGNISTFIGRLVPGIRQLISIPAGLAKMKLSSFFLYTFLGAFIWNIILAMLGYLASGQQALIEKYSHELSIIIVILLVLAVCFVGVKTLLKRRKSNVISKE